MRNWRPGDHYRRAGHEHDEKLKSLFHEFRVPLWERRSWPIICVGETVIWTRRFGAAAVVARNTSTTAILRIFEKKVDGS